MENSEAPNADKNDELPAEPKSDILLGVLVEAANKSGGSLGITLLVHGAMVTGVLIGGEEFFEGVAGQLEDALHENGEESSDGGLAAVFREQGTTLYGDPEALDDTTVAYIHLRDAQVYQSTLSAIPTPGTWWRGWLSSVDGWILGVLGRSEVPSSP